MFVTIYGRLSCPYCVRAKTLAEKLKILWKILIIVTSTSSSKA
ncbi:hypothetical protein HMPREF9996_01546 [Aggregatibacter actinomycetemcomitans Y4]|nr:hypothetical protein HMPREF9996_01546 [Aggregatibacter actinomycetemcomitans Y4]